MGEGEAEQAGVKGQTGGAWLGAGPVPQVQAGSPAAETNNSGLKRDHCGIQRFNVQAPAPPKKKLGMGGPHARLSLTSLTALN